MASYNHVTLMGNLTRDVEQRYSQSGTCFATIGIAVSKKFKQGEEWKEKTSFVDVKMFGRTAEIAGEYLKKGSPVLIDGELEQETWEKDGKRHSKLVVLCNRITLIGGKSGEPKSNYNPEPESQPVGGGGYSGGGGDDIPF